MPVHLRMLDQQSIIYESMAQRLGRDVADKAFYRALNHQGKLAVTTVKKKLAEVTSIKYSDIGKAIKTRTAFTGRLSFKIEASGRHIPIGNFSGLRQGKKGVTAIVWGQKQRFRGAFIVRSLGGQVFKNVRGWNSKAGRYNQIEKLYGPSIPEEMMKPVITAAFDKHGSGVTPRVIHELNLILNTL